MENQFIMEHIRYNPEFTERIMKNGWKMDY